MQGCFYRCAGTADNHDVARWKEGHINAPKQTSVSEEKYKPFLLEFAALKFSLDKFSNIIYGYPVIVKMDCQVL